MVRFKFFVHCDGWKDGGYYNTHFARNKTEAKRTINEWNEKYKRNGDNVHHVDLISIEKITNRKFVEDYIGGL